MNTLNSPSLEQTIALHRSILLRILKDIYTDQQIAPLLGFKGGTAAYFFYQLSRFSVDLDFDLLDEKSEELVFQRLEATLQTYGRLKQVDRKRFTLLFILEYAQKIPGTWNIKVEVNRRQFGSQYETKSYLGIPMQVMAPADLFAHKLVAMLERIGKANRDIYDVWFFLNHHFPINKEMVEQRMQMPFQEAVNRCIQALEKLPDRGILSGVGELLNPEQKKWAKQHLRKETLFLLQTAAF